MLVHSAADPLPVSVRSIVRIATVNAVVLAALLGLSEGAIHHALRNPSWIPDVLLPRARELYWNVQPLIQFTRACASYHEQLTYTLRPGVCVFGAPEFLNTYDVNHLGLRDDEASLEAPEIIVLGDSHAMGWGVEQNETFAQLLEAQTGRRVLNAAVSSYGTAREILNLRRLDRSRLRAVIIQYCDNDADENRSFLKHDAQLPIATLEDYLELVERQESTHYVFGHELGRLVEGATEAWRESNHGDQFEDRSFNDSGDHPNVAEEFLGVLDKAGVPLGGVRIIALELSNYRQYSEFVGLLQKALRSRVSAADGPTIQAFDAATVIGPPQHYRLDGHLNAEGHRILADALAKEIGSGR